MKTNNLLKISLIISILGLFLLTVILEYQEIPYYKINEITNKQIDKKIKIQGTLTEIKETQGLYILKIKDKNEITVIIFKDSELNLQKNSILQIEGRVQQYKNELEIIADQIIK